MPDALAVGVWEIDIWLLKVMRTSSHHNYRAMADVPTHPPPQIKTVSNSTPRVTHLTPQGLVFFTSIKLTQLPSKEGKMAPQDTSYQV